MSNVREFFPDVPEQCETCPGLVWAANWLDCSVSLAVISATEPDNLDSPLEPVPSEATELTMGTAMARHFSESASKDREAIVPVAQQLWGDCHAGVQVVEVLRGRFKKPAQKLLCGSKATLARFIPPQREGE